MKLGDILIVIFFLISIIGLSYMFGLGLVYMEHSAQFKVVGIITIISSIIDYGLLIIKNEN